MIFTEPQKKAIHHGDSNLQLIACAGSGKTEVIARRVAHLIKNGARPNNIIAFTFTEKAAAELKEWIISRCREELGEVHGMAEMYVGTIHAFCLDLLTTEVPKYLKFDVLNEVQQALFIDRPSNKSISASSRHLSSNFPAGPTNGRPCISSWLPGCSPIIMIATSTVLNSFLQNRQCLIVGYE